MISLQPREKYQIVRQLPDPADSTTYYIQAVVRDSVSDTILSTIQLTDKGSRRFKREYEVPADISGMGFYIDITTTVYTDSGYTSKSTTYGEELEQYLVFDRISKTIGGGHSTDVDYKKIQKMIDSAIKILTPKEVEKEDYSSILSALEGIKTDIASIEMPEAEKIELVPVMEAIKSTETTVLKAIDDKKIDFPEVDLDPILEAIDLKHQDMSDIEDKLDGIEKIIVDDIAEKNGTKEMKKLANILKPFLENNKQEEQQNEDPLQAKVKKML